MGLAAAAAGMAAVAAGMAVADCWLVKAPLPAVEWNAGVSALAPLDSWMRPKS